ncbi:leucyl-tRNA synthetase [Ceraceosorus guamensis]|uniref:leucine--tRNA ligase n=1 Tax=Ceraceosorus guamensis TaxID=1522189 RepID=A0A316VWP3_9BASI|nr:leucyl-tRNA synthetase [Ceraceosorus guamensis]PWN42036.1 leucyl-tRNA synthetase [Ceraceosorus guamensis]
MPTQISDAPHAEPGHPAESRPGGPIQLENTSKRDYLQSLEKQYQSEWGTAKYFEVDSPMVSEKDAGLETMSPEEIRKKYPKTLFTFPFAYANGSLHLGHAFSLSKIEFATGYERMKGKRALFPWAFHCTGMPIRACADKLQREIELFGPDFSGFDPETENEAAAVEATAAAAGGGEAANVGKATKGKVAAKSTGLKYQFQIMEATGVPREEIHKFADAQYWLHYYPPISKADCTAIGARIDWRRAFLTTDINPYFDSFVRWQINKLRAMDKIKFGERYTIYSPKDGQPCMDHDRAEGEALGPQEYTGLKMEVVQWSANAAPELDAKLQGKNVYFVAATLRPETMYGQTNCYVGPSINYGLFAINDKDVYLCTERAARNMAFQGVTSERGEVKKLASIAGSKLVGTRIKAPFGHYPEVYILPMDSVLPTKGTGVVTSVPSDSPDDYANLMELRKKAEYYKVDPQWVSYDPFPVITTPTYGDLTAETLCKQLKIQSPKDAKQLAEAKELAYKEGFYSGKMVTGQYKGEAVQDAKPKVRQDMIDAGLAFAYAEPEGKVVSRSADDCVVALCDQWYIDYGEDKWKMQAEKLVAQMQTFNDETRNGFEGVLGWLHQWACARSYGLGSKLPWDEQFLVESLSDSTIYMAYYTVSHFLQDGVVDGSKVGPLGIQAKDLTDDVWDYILSDTAYPQDSAISKEVLTKLRREFRYFYPMDLRSSGKDLIPNHLTFCVYVHAALFPEEHWPQAMRINGHLMLNGKKMSKSTGNVLTLRQAVDKFGADATRISLADAGDGIEDANFEEKTANANILRIHTLLDWCDAQMSDRSKLRSGPKDSFWDAAFENDMNLLVEQAAAAYEESLYREALKFGWYELLTARDLYREATADIGMHVELIEQWIRVQALIMTPIAPHFAEHLWKKTLGNEKQSVQVQRWPALSKPIDKGLSDAATYVRATTKTIRDGEATILKRKSKGKDSSGFDPKKPKAVKVFVATEFPNWQNACVQAIKSHLDEKTGAVDDKGVRQALAEAGIVKDKRVMPFVMNFKRRLAEFGPSVAFNRALPFDELATLQSAAAYLKRTLGLQELHVALIKDAQGDDAKIAEHALPAEPAFDIYNVEA